MYRCKRAFDVADDAPAKAEDFSCWAVSTAFVSRKSKQSVTAPMRSSLACR
jgi:hypothetical protein